MLPYLRCLMISFFLMHGWMSGSFAASLESMSGIEFWVGNGANQAALVIDWEGRSTSDSALVWGYRWDGLATGADMLLAIVTADERLFARLGDTGDNPVKVFGIGYDANNDGRFALDDQTLFETSGIAVTDAAEGAVATGGDDFYAEGWFTKFWHYAVADANPFGGGNWTSSPLGMAARTLSDGSWDGWAFADPISFDVFAANPQAASPAPRLGDYNRDGTVGAADYTSWRNTLGQLVARPGDLADGNADGLIDSDDYHVWKQNLSESPAPPSIVSSVPEPASLIALICLPLFMLFRRPPAISARNVPSCFTPGERSRE